MCNLVSACCKSKSLMLAKVVYELKIQYLPGKFLNMLGLFLLSLCVKVCVWERWEAAEAWIVVSIQNKRSNCLCKQIHFLSQWSKIWNGKASKWSSNVTSALAFFSGISTTGPLLILHCMSLPCPQKKIARSTEMQSGYVTEGENKSKDYWGKKGLNYIWKDTVGILGRTF